LKQALPERGRPTEKENRSNDRPASASALTDFQFCRSKISRETVNEHFLDGRVTFHCGDCLELLPTLAENSLDACVTDPPYHLTSIVKRFGGNGAAPAQYGSDGRYARASAGFMGKQWDGGDIAFRAEVWRQVWRVLKPGAHLLAFGGTRTYHRMACAIEDAGFEIRDTIMWVYGNGFPKSHDVSKGIDKSRDEDEPAVRAICRVIRQAMDNIELKSKDLVHHFGDCHPRLVDHWAARDSDSQPALPTWRQWQKLQEILSLDCSLDEEVMRLNERKGEPSDVWKTAEVVGEYPTMQMGFGDYRFTVRDNKKRASSDAARQWQGWGTALKPAVEMCVLARKPLSEHTVAANVLKWGTGAINIDGCRVGLEGGTAKGTFPKGDSNGIYGNGINGACDIVDLNKGRWPANFIHDGSEEVVAGFPDSKSCDSPSDARPEGSILGGRRSQGAIYPGEDGSAARYFYTAKADSDDRLGSKHPTVKPLDLMQYLVRLITPKVVLCCPKCEGSGIDVEGRSRQAEYSKTQRADMSALRGKDCYEQTCSYCGTKLVQRPGRVIDPFAGTGTTGEAAFREGMRAVLIERETEYQADIRRRMELVLAGPDERLWQSIKIRGQADSPGPLFDWKNDDLHHQAATKAGR
jgi:DNA modification methylase